MSDVFLIRLEFWGLRSVYDTFLKCKKLTPKKQNVKYAERMTTKLMLGRSTQAVTDVARRRSQTGQQYARSREREGLAVLASFATMV